MKSLASTSLGAVAGISAAAMFGASTPLAKRLVDDVRPQLLAGLLYAGAAIVLVTASSLGPTPNEAKLQRVHQAMSHEHIHVSDTHHHHAHSERHQD